MIVLDAFVFYWPRLIGPILFLLFSLRVIKNRYSFGRLFLRGVVLFLISGVVISILGELVFGGAFSLFLVPKLHFEKPTIMALYTFYCMVMDFASFIIPIIIYSKIMEFDFVMAATIYCNYVLQDRVSLIISNTKIGYLIVYGIALLISFAYQHKDIAYIAKNPRAVNWKPVLFYNVALFFILDGCYGAYNFFEELEVESINGPVIWLYGIVVIACAFSAGFSRLNVSLSKEHEKKISYMKKFLDGQTDIIRDFATISEAKSGETGQHIRRVSEYTAILANQILSNEIDVNYVKVASMMHDIGKLMIPNEIIEKPGLLTEEEYEIIKTHAEYGNDLLSHNHGTIMSIARTIAYEHHERWDGDGYPQGLKGEEISIYAQIVSVADVYDALTSHRSYKEAWAPKDARKEIINQRGRQFSPRVVDAFVDQYDKIEEIRQMYAD